VAIQPFTKLSANSAATYTAGQSTEDGARDCPDGDAKRSGKSADSGAYLATGECGARSSCSAADGANNGAYRHGCSEGSNFSGVTARALK
jgi:hypothetical protein